MDSQGQSIETRIGTLSFTHDFANGYPTEETVEKLYDERDFQRACQAYLWALPIVSAGEMERVIMQAPGAAYGDILSLVTFPELSRFLTPMRQRLTRSPGSISPRAALMSSSCPQAQQPGS